MASKTLEAHKGPANVVVFNSDGSYLLSGGQDRQVVLWNANTGNRIKAFSGHGYDVSGITVAPDSSRFVSCGGDRAALLWDVAAGVIVRRMAGHSARLNAVALNKDASLLASGSFDSTVRLWDLRSQQRSPIQTLQDAKDSITSISIHDAEIVAASVDGYVRTYDVRMGELRSDFFDQPVSSVSLAEDASTMLVALLPSLLRLIDRSNGELLQSFRDSEYSNESYRSHATFSHDEEHVIAGDEKGSVLIWSVVNGTLTGNHAKAHRRAVLWTEKRPGQTRGCASASADGSVNIWDFG